MTKEREMLRKLLDSMQFHMPDPHLVAEAQALLAEDEPVKVWEPSKKGHRVDSNGVVCAIAYWGARAADFGTVYPNKESASHAKVAMHRHNRLLCYALTHWPELEQPGSYEDVQRREWYGILGVSYGWKVVEINTYSPGFVYCHTKEQAQQVCNALNSGELVL